MAQSLLFLLLLFPLVPGASWSIYDPHPTASSWNLHLFPSSSGARCLDGSPAGYYWREGVGADASKVMVHLQGGGWVTSLEDAAYRARTDLGSSLGWPRSSPGGVVGPVRKDGGEAGMISPSTSVNPDLQGWCVMYVPYCDGGSFAGDVASPVAVGGGTHVHFRGLAILDAAIAALRERLPRASEIILKGCSAGGLAVFLHADYFAAAWDPAVTRVVAAPEAGLFLDTPGIDGAMHYQETFRWVFAAQNASGGVNAACRKHYAAQPGSPLWRCFHAQYTLPFIRTPLFISNSAVDSWSAWNIMGLRCNPGAQGAGCGERERAYLDSFQEEMLRVLAPALAPPSLHGAFIQSCFVHVVANVDASWAGTHVQGQTQAETFRAWYTGAGGGGAATSAIDAPRYGSNSECYGNAWRMREQRDSKRAKAGGSNSSGRARGGGLGAELSTQWAAASTGGARVFPLVGLALAVAGVLLALRARRA